MNLNQAKHTRIATSLLHSSRGDLMLDKRGDLCSRVTFDEGAFTDLDWEHHRIGEKLAIISRDGWTLTKSGAEYILSNSIFDKRDRRFLETVRGGV